MTLLFLLLTFTLQSQTLTGKVVRVSDGDTIVILDENKDQYPVNCFVDVSDN